MKNDNRVVMGIFKNSLYLERAVESLRAEGFRSADISALIPSPETTKELAHVNSSKMPEGASTGGTAGVILGGTLGWLAGIGSLAIPGLGPFVAAGPIMALLAGAGVGAGVGGVAGALIGLGIPEYEAKRYDGFVREGGYLISVHCDTEDWVRKAQSILERSGAKSISATAEQKSSSPEGISSDIPRMSGPHHP